VFQGVGVVYLPPFFKNFEKNKYMSDTIQHWTNEASRILLNKKIVQVRYMTEQEQQVFGWQHKAVVIQLDDNTLVFPSKDDEGNDAGALHYLKDGEGDYCLPVI
jgi:hypothetical protein